MLAMSSLFASLLVLATLLNLSDGLNSIALTWIICLSGNVLGIPIGMLASPYEGEGGHFEKLGALAASFASGYLLSQFSRHTAELDFSDSTLMGRTLLFVSFWVLGALQTFVFRRYSDDRRKKDVYQSEALSEQDGGLNDPSVDAPEE